MADGMDEKRRLELQNTLNRCGTITAIFDSRMDSVNCKAFHAIREIMDIYLAAAIRQISSNVAVNSSSSSTRTSAPCGAGFPPSTPRSKGKLGDVPPQIS